MPKNKDLKRLVRTRMKKTGESYTAARGSLLNKTKKKPSGKPSPGYATLAGMSDDAVEAKTGRNWAQWVRALDAVDAHTLPHREIASHLRSAHGLTNWWSQTVTVGYERIRGLREVGQRCGGLYEANKSRTFDVPVEKLHRAFADSRMRAKWLRQAGVVVRTSTPPKSVRMTWPDGTRVETTFVTRGTRSQVAVQHRGLASRSDVERRKVWWSERLDALRELLSGQ